MIINVEKLLEKKLKDEVVIFETDTVYGIGCLIDSEIGIQRIYDIKKREAKRPLAVLCANIEQVKSLVLGLDECESLAKNHWPGALTLVLKKNRLVSDSITSKLDTVGVRIPNNQLALDILKKFGPMAVTSLNISSEPAILKFKDAVKFEDKVDYLVKGTDLSSISSTVYDCVNKKTLRQGNIVIG